MYPFSFQNPTRIEFGLDKEKEMGKYMHEYGAKKALIIYGSERVKQSGLFEDVAKSLREHGIEYIECGGVKATRQSVKFVKPLQWRKTLELTAC